MILEVKKSEMGYIAICQCDNCEKEFTRPQSRIKRNKQHFCNRNCMGKWNSTNRIGENASMYGKRHTEETKQKLRENNRDVSGENNPMYGKGRFGADNPMWKGGRKKNNNYISIKNYEHPFCTKEGYVLEHRLIMEEHLGRFLEPREVVHHKDGIGTNNNIENLELFANQAEHVAYHNRNGGDCYGYAS